MHNFYQMWCQIQANIPLRISKKFLLDKELTVKCLVETYTKLGDLILAAVVLCGLNPAD